jgi:hypothetical protein
MGRRYTKETGDDDLDVLVSIAIEAWGEALAGLSTTIHVRQQASASAKLPLPAETISSSSSGTSAGDGNTPSVLADPADTDIGVVGTAINATDTITLRIDVRSSTEKQGNNGGGTSRGKGSATWSNP